MNTADKRVSLKWQESCCATGSFRGPSQTAARPKSFNDEPKLTSLFTIFQSLPSLLECFCCLRGLQCLTQQATANPVTGHYQSA